uniref:Coat protein n=1 Tax=Quinoa-associated deltapartitivirus 2 TaxID=2824809 RepID=A0A8D9UGS3_9VIRU|nr:TPA_asm: coat protein [Quinoa-associated deltapartitivirus 2]
MDSTDNTLPTETPVTTTSQKRPNKEHASSGPHKKNISRKGDQSASDYLLDQNRIGWINHQPIGKRRYIALRLETIMNSLLTLYTTFFKTHTHHFHRALEKATNNMVDKDTSVYAATVYLTHWLFDTYRTIRESVKKLDPIAFNEYYWQEVPTNSDVYDNFLSSLNSALRPTQINFNTAEEMYIPVYTLSQLDWTRNIPFPWSKSHFDYTSFLTITQIMENKKLCTLTPLSSDPTGRPSWLFDWHSKGTEVYAWFPMENNFNFVDVTIAYIIGVACSPKLGSCDRDEWVNLNPATINLNALSLNNVERKTSRTWRGNSEVRTFEAESNVAIPHVTETDNTKFRASNKGPYKIKSALSSEEEVSSSSIEDTDTTVPSSPRIQTRSSSTLTMDKGVHRVRIIDFCYNGQIVMRIDDTTRVAAFKKFLS